MPKKVYLVRHGESVHGEQAVYQSTETELSAQGRAQAEVLARRFAGISIDLVYTSEFPRAHQTAETINAVLKTKLSTEALLNELKRPTEIIGEALNDPEALRIKKTLREHAHDPLWHFSDEENFYDLRARVQKFLHLLEADTHEHILIVSHAMILRVLAMLMLFGPDAGHEVHHVLYDHFRMTQSGITLFEHNDKGWLLMTWNDYAHLGEDKTEDFYRKRQDV